MIGFVRLDQPSLTIFVLAVTVFPYSIQSSYDDCNFITRMLCYDTYWLSVPPERFLSMTLCTLLFHYVACRMCQLQQ